MTSSSERLTVFLTCAVCVSCFALQVWAAPLTDFRSKSNGNRPERDIDLNRDVDLWSDYAGPAGTNRQSHMKSIFSDFDYPQREFQAASRVRVEPDANSMGDYSMSRMRSVSKSGSGRSGLLSGLGKRSGHNLSMGMPMRLTADYLKDIARRRNYNDKYFHALTSLAEIGK